MRLTVPNRPWANLTDAELLSALQHLEQTPFVVRLTSAIETLIDTESVLDGIREKLGY